MFWAGSHEILEDFVDMYSETQVLATIKKVWAYAELK